MINKKIKMIFMMLICASVTISASIILGFENFLSTGSAVASNDNEVWGHYSALEPEYENPGSKEFWISCSTHSIRYEAPTTGTIENRGTPTVEQIKSWGNSDVRYIPQYKIDDSHLWYGYYPQTNVNDDSLISVLNTLTNPNEFDYYFYNNDYYYKYSATPAKTSYSFDNGKTIVKGVSYWFKVEAINWKVLENNDGIFLVATESLLINHHYGDGYSGTKSTTDYQGHTGIAYANNYKYSHVRSWLNTDFYNQAFFLKNDNIEVSLVDNSATSTGYSANSYACENTNDKLFLLSAKELSTESYGFKSSFVNYDSARQCKTTDFARAHGAVTSSVSSWKNCGWYFTRSPDCDDSWDIRPVDDGGSGYGTNPGYSEYGSVRPALRLSL